MFQRCDYCWYRTHVYFTSSYVCVQNETTTSSAIRNMQIKEILANNNSFIETLARTT
jgi:hypothetical protein